MSSTKERKQELDRGKYHTGTGRALERLFETTKTDHGRIYEVRVKFDEGSALAVLKARTGEGLQIAFVGSDGAVAALRKAAGLRRRGQLPWREDRPYKPPVDDLEDDW